MRRFVFIALLVLSLSGIISFAGAMAQEAPLVDLLPSAAEIGPGFVVADHRARGLDEQATGFSAPGDAASLLANWRWQENAYQRFTDDASGETVEISLTRFASETAAAEALAYFLEDRAAILGQGEVRQLAPVGDESRALNGFVNGAFDYTLYARSGPLLIRISASSAQGSPAVSPETIARGIMERATEVRQPAVAELAVADLLPGSLPLAATTCSWNEDDSKLDIPSFIERFDGVPDAAATLASMDWQEGDYRQFACDTPAEGGIGWVSLAVHRFGDAQAAADAVDFFADSRSLVTRLQEASAPALGDRAAALSGPTVNGTEYTLFLSDGPLLFRVTGVAPQGDPRADVEAIAAALYERHPGDLTSANPPSGPTSTPQAVIIAPTPTIAPAAAATQLPTREPIPTAPPLPTPTLVPPTAAPTTPPAPTAIPTETPLPTLVPVTVPTAAPPTATTGSPPTPTPRVIHPPTPDAG